MQSLWYIHIPLFLANLIYAGNYTIAKEVVPHYIPPAGMILVRVTSGTCLFWLFHAWMLKEKITSRNDYLLLATCALFGVAINQLMFFKGLALTTPINASLIMTTCPLIVLLAAYLFARERLTGIKIIGIVAGLTGAVLLLLTGENFSFGSDTALGDVFILINASAYAIYLVLVKSLMVRYHPLTVIKWVFFFGIFYVIPFGWKEFSSVNWTEIPTAIWGATAYVVVMTTFFAYLLNSIALRSANPSVVGIYIYLQPVLAALIAVIFSKDILTVSKIIYSLLIFMGVYLVSYPSRDKTLPSPTAPV